MTGPDSSFSRRVLPQTMKPCCWHLMVTFTREKPQCWTSSSRNFGVSLGPTAPRFDGDLPLMGVETVLLFPNCLLWGVLNALL